MPFGASTHAQPRFRPKGPQHSSPGRTPHPDSFLQARSSGCGASGGPAAGGSASCRAVMGVSELGEAACPTLNTLPTLDPLCHCPEAAGGCSGASPRPLPLSEGRIGTGPPMGRGGRASGAAEPTQDLN